MDKFFSICFKKVMTSSDINIGRLPGQSGESGSHHIFLLCYLAALGAFPSFVNDLYLPTLPQMRIDFHASRSTVQLGLSFVMIGLGFGELLWGPLSDRIGRRPVLFMSLTLFMIASAASVFSPAITFFIICRLFQGLGASGAIMLSRTIPADEYQGMQLAKFMALIGAINGIAPVSGPLVGGFLATSIGWRGIFVLLTCVGAVMLLLGLRMRETLVPAKRKTGSLIQLMGEFAPLLRNRHFMVHVMLKSAALGVLFSYISAGPFIVQEHYGLSPLQFGLIFGLNALAIVLGSVVCLRFSTMKRAAVTGAAGMVAFAITEAVAIAFIDSLLLFEALIIPMLFFSGLVFASANSLAMSEGKVSAGSASAILGLGGYIFGFIVSPLVGLGNILRSTSIALVVCALIALYYAWRSFLLPKMPVQP